MARTTLKGQAVWSIVLQFSRFGGNAVVFLALARFLTLEQIGAFGMAYAPIRWTQALHKSGISNSVVASIHVAGDCRPDDRAPAFTALFWLSLGVTGFAVLGIGLLAWGLARTGPSGEPVAAMMLVMLAVPVAFGLSAVSEGLLQKRLQVRALALRTVVVQIAAAVVAVWLARAGWGAWSLVGFAGMNAVASAVLSIILAGWRPHRGPCIADMKAELPQMTAISARAVVAAGTRPMMQVAIGLVLGLDAAGAFQIAQRIYQILDALCLAPIRFLVLPLFARARDAAGGVLSGDVVLRGLGIAGLVTAPVYVGTLVVAAPALDLAIGPDNARAAVLPLQILCLLGFNITAVTILTQAATAAGYPGLPLRRAMLTFVLTLAFGAPALLISTEAVTAAFVAGSYVALARYFIALGGKLRVAATDLVAAVLRPYLAALLAFLPLAFSQWIVRADFSTGGYALALLVTLVSYAGLVWFLAPGSWHDLATRRPVPAFDET
ncbi:MAG TPA: hypothetical protein DEO85_04290 [Maritimibacter sp.]|nr:hypothetical protein [Maritimibacter sp.]